jgi:hypothetical protein
MLQSIANAHARHAYALIAALDAREITSGEFDDALLRLPSEILQVTATMIGLMEFEHPPALSAARAMCIKQAARSRSLS